MAKIPEKVRIVGKNWRVSHPNSELRADRNYGETDSLGLELKVSNEFPVAQQRETLMHEIIHAIGYSLLTRTDLPKERLIKPLANGLIQALRDNPDMVTFFMDSED